MNEILGINTESRQIISLIDNGESYLSQRSERYSGIKMIPSYIVAVF